MTEIHEDLPQWTKPLPNVDADSAPLWEGFRSSQLLLWHCDVCGAWYWPKSLCRNHESITFDQMSWKPVTGHGQIFVFNTHHIAFHPGFKDEVPFVYALAKLDEGPLFSANVEGCLPENVYIGMPIEVGFRVITDEYTMPVFRPSSR